MSAHQNCSIKKYISKYECTSKLLPQKIHFKTSVIKKIFTDEHKNFFNNNLLKNKKKIYKKSKKIFYSNLGIRTLIIYFTVCLTGAKNI